MKRQECRFPEKHRFRRMQVSDRLRRKKPQFGWSEKCESVKMCKCESVKMCKCESVKM